MYCHKKIIYSSKLILTLVLGGCATSYAPNNWLPDTDEVPQSTRGGWITVETEEINNQPETRWLQYSGEFIAVDEENIYVLYDSLYIIPRVKILNSIIELDQKNTGIYGGWVVLGSLATISNGYYLALTFPLWMVAGIPAVSGESYRDRYEAESPGEIYWNAVNKYSRFPQGLSTISLSKLQPIFKKLK
jgi:hypothetical protein